MGATASSPAEILAPGTRIGRYELVRRLAVGGMAEIHLARATGIEGFEKLVVLKRILPQFAVKENFVEMFLDEARLSATLEHPNIAQVYDIGELGGSYFFTMEYVRGEDVRSILETVVTRGQRIPLEHALTIITAAAAGLHAAHERRGPDGLPLGIVHRDASPSNVLVSYDGAVKLVDFGVAKATHRQSETRTGTLKGKAAYMSPEQCTASDIDRRSDVFALGILLYELTTCRRLFQGDTEFAIMSKIVHEDATPPSQDVPSYPADLEPIVMRALSRDREGRYQTAQELQIELEEFARRHQLRVSPVGLAGYMHEVFADRIGQHDIPAPTNPQGEGTSLDADDLEVEIEIADGAPRRAQAGRRRKRWIAVAALGLAAAAVVVAVPAMMPASTAGDDRVPADGRSRVEAQRAAEGTAEDSLKSAPEEPPSEEIAPVEAADEELGPDEPEMAGAEAADAGAEAAPEPARSRASRETRTRREPRTRKRAPASNERKKPSWNPDAPLPPPGSE